MMFKCQMFIKIIPNNLILLVSPIVADPILILVLNRIIFCTRRSYISFCQLIQIRFDVRQLLTLLSSLLRVNVNSITFPSANEVDRVLS